MTPSASVLIPTYNGEAFIAECLESVLAQTYPEFEVVVVDDCSSDATVEIANAHASRDARIRVVRNDSNIGLVSNWARCIELAQGEWIKFVFQDDFIAPECIEQLIEEGERSGCPLVFCRRQYLFADGTSEPVRQFYRDHATLTEERFQARGFVPPAAVARMILSAPTPESNFIGEPIAVLFKKSLVQRFGPFNPLLAVSCDSEFWQRIGVNVGVAHVPAELATFRVHQGATTSTHLREKDFRMNVLDPVVALHEQAFHPAFEPLRQVARQQGKNLESMFNEKASWAFNSARYQASPDGGGDTAALMDWRRLATSLQRLRQIEAEASSKPGVAARAMAKARRLLAGG